MSFHFIFNNDFCHLWLNCPCKWFVTKQGTSRALRSLLPCQAYDLYTL